MGQRPFARGPGTRTRSHKQTQEMVPSDTWQLARHKPRECHKNKLPTIFKMKSKLKSLVYHTIRSVDNKMFRQAKVANEFDFSKWFLSKVKCHLASCNESKTKNRRLFPRRCLLFTLLARFPRFCFLVLCFASVFIFFGTRYHVLFYGRFVWGFQ